MSDWKVEPLARRLASIESGCRPKGGIAAYTDGVPSLSAEQMRPDGTLSFETVRYVPHEFFATAKKGKIRRGDILVVKDGATTGKTAFAGDDFPFADAMVNEHTFILRTKPTLLPKLAFLCLHSEMAVECFTAAREHGMIGGLTQSFPEEIEIPVPPLAEQRRLVARIEALTSRLEQARQARQAALSEAELIMQSHRSRLLEDYAEENLTRFGELVAETQLGLVRSKEQQSEGHLWPYLKMNNITTAGTLNLDSFTSVEASAEESEKFRLADGDFLFNTRNSYELVGKTTVWRERAEPFLYYNNIMRIRFRPDVEPRFVNAVFLTPAVQSQLDGFKKQTTSVCAIYWKNLKNVEIPRPPLPEQKRIADSLDALAAKQTELRRLQTETEAALAAFTPALLASAFRGEL